MNSRVENQRQAAIATRSLLGALVMITVAPAMANTCPPGQNPTAKYEPTGVVRTMSVPGTAFGMRSGIFIQPGFRYDMRRASSGGAPHPLSFSRENVDCDFGESREAPGSGI